MWEPFCQGFRAARGCLNSCAAAAKELCKQPAQISSDFLVRGLACGIAGLDLSLILTRSEVQAGQRRIRIRSI